jgi:signal transduction histidine kinase
MPRSRALSAVRSSRDELLVGALLVLGAVDLWIVGEGFHGGTTANAVYLAACVVPLLWRRTAPVAAYVAVLAATGAGMALLYDLSEQAPIEPFLALLVALYSLGAYTPGRTQALTLGATAPLALAHDVAATAAGAEPGNVWPPYVFFAAAVITGRGVRRYRQLTAALQERTHERARLAVLEERSRMARELHDVIAHAVSVMVVQAAAERRARPGAAPETTATLDQIERTGREALVELRRLLGVLRHPGEDAARVPQPSLARLDALVDEFRDAGLAVDLRVEGAAATLPAGVDLAAYRIVQEALTNTLKHAHARRAEVVVRFEPRAVGLDVRDDGPGHANGSVVPGAGHGLAGMRERVALHGGDLSAGRRADGPGFAVSARLPYEGAS